MILHRDLKLENVLLTEAPKAQERKIYPKAAAAAAGSCSPKKKSEKTGREKGAKEEAKPRPEAKLADFGLAVSFVSPDIVTRRSALPRYISSLASAILGGSSAGGKGKEKKEEATTAAATTTAAPQQQQQQLQQKQDKLGDRRVSAVQAQMLRADAGQAMDDAAVARAASELETALSKWTGVVEAEAAAKAAGGGGAPTPSSSSTPLAAAAAAAGEARRSLGQPASLGLEPAQGDQQEGLRLDWEDGELPVSVFSSSSFFRPFSFLHPLLTHHHSK